MKKQSGFTLMEIIISIVISGIIAGLLVTCYRVLLNNSPLMLKQATATQLASKCIEWYLGQRYLNGFTSSSLITGSNVPAFCNVSKPTGYNISTNVNSVTLYGDTKANYKVITVTVNGPNPASATLSTMLANY